MGNKFSWNNHQSNRIACKLDRVLVNLPWMHNNANSYVQYLSEGLSDHSPLQVMVQPTYPSGPCPFKYFQAWECHPGFADVVSKAWQQQFHGSPMFKLVHKLQHLKTILKDWNKEVFGPIQVKLLSSRQHLEAAQSALSQQPTDSILMDNEARAKESYLSMLRQEESFLRQKSRQTWLSEGDRNSKFFYFSIKARIAQNSIRRVQLADGTYSEDPSLIKHHVIFYVYLFTYSLLLFEGFYFTPGNCAGRASGHAARGAHGVRAWGCPGLRPGLPGVRAVLPEAGLAVLRVGTIGWVSGGLGHACASSVGMRNDPGIDECFVSNPSGSARCT
ncbi:hypothetical protein QJS10_CPA01g02060 [Acorus calamus]|uniref:Uncharacterized protein n=1 Tax=Acorus calamus TaxID=4465 RepID=A0AAV9FK52_ACOCL|nr:hypothetical protein QJS10_CPA01g02060 [Acorus calamus]